jgi:ligand-binding sensor domain-containing protein/signal transduction histidine kinase
LLGWALPAGATVPTPPNFGLDDQSVEVWETAHGLPQSTVTAITQTRDGYLWVGTLDGLACFDGIRFQVFDSFNTPELHSNQITALAADEGGGLWIGTAEGGATHLVQGKFEALTRAQGLADDAVRSFGIGGDGSVWIGTATGLNVWRGGRLELPAADSDAVRGPVVAVCKTGAAGPWMLGQDALYQAEGAQVKRLALTLGTGVPTTPWQGLASGQGDTLWMFGSSLLRVSVATLSGSAQAANLASGDRINALCERRDGEVWFGTEAGELRRLGRNAAATHAVGGGVRHAVRCIFEDRELNLWLGLEGGGLVRIKPKQVGTFGIRDGLPGEHITGTCPDGSRGFWVACHAAGIAHWSEGEFREFTANGALPSGCIVWSLLRTRDGSLWIGTEGAGLLRWKNERLEHFGPAEGVPQSAIVALAETRDGSLWLGGRDGGLLRRNAEGFSHQGADEGFDGEPITVLANDRKGGLWIGTGSHGLYHFNDGKFSCFTQADGLGDNHVRSLMVDNGGVLWVGTSGGLTRLRDGVFANFSTRDGLWDNVISQILEDTLDPVQEDQQLWLGSNRGISRIRKASFEDYLLGKTTALEPVVYGRAEGMDCLECSGGFGPAGLVQTPAENPDTKSVLLWFATLRGLVRLDVFPLLGRARDISGDHIAFAKAHLHLGPDDTRFDLGDVVAGGNGFGRGRVAGITAVTGELGPSNTSVYADAANTATARYHRTKLPFIDGVFIPDGSAVPGQMAVISSTGLQAEFPATTGQAYGLLKSGWNPINVDVFNPSEMQLLGVPLIWMSGNQGITFDLDAIRRASGKTIERFTAQVCNLHIGPASFHVLLDGRVVASRSGMVHDNDRFEHGIVALDLPIGAAARFLTLATTDDKDEIGAFNRVAPTAIIEEVWVDGSLQKADLAADARPASAGGFGSLHQAARTLEIAPGAGRLELRYAAPSLVAPEKVRFRYRLEPLEKAWVEARDRRIANYSQLAPGAYRFVVTACNNDGVWNAAGSAVSLTLRPHFWQARWFAPLWITALAVTLAAVTGLVLRTRHRRRIKRLKQHHALVAERERISRDIHDDLGAGLTHVSLLSDLARHDIADPGRAMLHLDQVAVVAQRLARGVDEIVWAINPKNDALEYSLNFICTTAQDFLRAAGIACRLEWPELMAGATLSSARRHQLYLALREVLNNIVKHAAATEVRLHLAATLTELTVVISDDGCGFVPSPPGAPASVRHGLDGMAARMAAVGGTCSVTSHAGQGTEVTLSLPLARKDKLRSS